MAEQVIERIESDDSSQRVLIVRRSDAMYSYRRQRRLDDGNSQSTWDWPEGYEPEAGWQPPGPHCGLYDSEATARWQALCRIDWLQSTRPAN